MKNVLKNFKIDGEVISVERYGEGHINETYLAVVMNNETKTNYILQKINNKLFTNVEKLMNNIKLVTEYNRQKITQRGGNPDRESLSLVYTKDNKSYYFCPECNGYFRVYVFITDATAHQKVTNPDQFYQSAVAFGEFANLLAEFDAKSLYEVIPNFHNTVSRFENFKKSLDLDKFDRAKLVQDEINFVLSRENYCSKIVDLLNSGKMPTKVTHNDTKLNNVMLDDVTNKPVAVIDLDTIMPGSICYDFGDSIRFGCNTGAEDERDLTKVNFDIDLFEYYTKGYLKALGNTVTEVEKNNLSFGAILMTFECGMRFLADYLDGDIYFRTHREGHNLDRARTQFKLVKDMELCFDEMNKIVDKYYKK